MAGPAQNHVLQLGALGSNMVAPDHPTLNPTDALTIEFWCFPEDNGTFGRAVSKRGGTFGSYSLEVNASASFCPDAAFSAALYSQTSGYFPSGAFIACGEWSHVAVVAEGSTGEVRIYQNAVLASTSSFAPFSLVDSGDAFRLGTTPGFSSDTQYEGLLDNVRVWTSARSQQEIEALMFVDLSATDAHLYPDLGASWGFESGTDDATGVNGGTLEGGL